MYFTQEDYRKIEAYLKSKAARDTSFDSATTPLQGNETIVLVQGGKNVNTTVSDIVSQFFALGVSDFINVTDKYGISYNTLDEAIRVIPWRSRKVGQVITFLNEQGEWHLYQYQGESILTWNNTTLWVDLLESRIVNSILPDQEDLTMTEPDADGNSYMHFKDKDYSIDDFSGLGRVYLRKNLQTLTDPNTGETRLINYLTQTMVGKENVIYHIQYDYNLNGQTIIIPEGCVLLFEGGSISNGTINCTNTEILGTLGGFESDLILNGSIKGEEVLFDWWKCDRIDRAVYNSFINGNNAEFGEKPSISTKNRTILTNMLGRKYSITFGKGIYPFDSGISASIGSYTLKGSGRNNTLLWFPNSSGFTGLISTNSIIENIWIESEDSCITTNTGTYPHAPIFRDSAFISYNSTCFNNLGVTYGGLFENLLVYSNKESAFSTFGSNSNIFRNVVDSHVFFDGSSTNVKGYMFAMFYNCSCKEYANFNVTYSGFQYLFYYNNNVDSIARISIHDGTLEMDYKDDTKFIRVVHIEDSSNLWNLDISYFNVYRIGKGKDNIDFYLRRSSNSLKFSRAQEGITLLASTVTNESDYVIRAVTPNIDNQNTKKRILISMPHSGTSMNLYNNISQNVEVFKEYKVPTEWYSNLDSISYLGILSSPLYNNIAIPSVVTPFDIKIEDVIYREKFGRIEFKDSETGTTKQIPIVPNNIVTPSTWADIDSFFARGDQRIIFQITSDIDLGGITGRVRPSWIFLFNGGSLNNGTIPANNSVRYINRKGTAVIVGSKDFGTTSNRPVLTTLDIGHQYYDTTLEQIIIWDGTKWINEDGTLTSKVVIV